MKGTGLVDRFRDNLAMRVGFLTDYLIGDMGMAIDRTPVQPPMTFN